MYVNQKIFEKVLELNYFQHFIKYLEIDCNNFEIFVKTKILINRNHFYYMIYLLEK